MTRFLPHLLCLLIAAAGWHYLFYSTAGHKLAGHESPSANRLRIRLRRIGGLGMMGLALLIYLGLEIFDPSHTPHQFILAWTGVTILMLMILVLALIDMRLTRIIRQRSRDRQP
ncbi:MAG: hypothetical protein IT448_07435 [Phycisphaerales bacterium]|nr:hypothetical protein [Phycisphaerales bacterium]